MAAGAITGEQRLQIEVKLDTKGLKRGTAEYRKALLRMTNATKKANLAQAKLAGGAEKLRANNRGASAAIIELGRGASDARFGFHGLGNNLERATELMGSLIKKNGGLKGAFKALGASVMGPAGIVVGITVLIAYGPAIIGWFKSLFTGATKSKEEIAKLKEEVEQFNKEIDTLISTQNKLLGQYDDPAVEKWRRKLVSASKDVDTLNQKVGELEKAQYDLGRQVLLDNNTLEVRATIGVVTSKEEKEVFEKRAAQYASLTKLLKEYEKILDDAQKRQSKANKIDYPGYAEDLAHVIELQTTLGKSKKQLAEIELDYLENLDKSKLSEEQKIERLRRMQILTTGLAVGFFDAKVEIEDVEGKIGELLDSLLSKSELFVINWHTTLARWLEEEKITFEEFLDLLDKVDQALAKQASSSMSQADRILNTGITNMIKSAADAFASGDNLGEGLLRGVGTILTQLGGLLIVSGLGIEAFKESLKSLNGPVAIAAGVAMVVAGAAFASAAKKAGGGSGSATRSTPSSSTTTPTSIQADGGVGALVATIRGQEIRFIQQAASDSYSAIS